jgi:uncharacterized protein YlxW (UPF0749 family)
MRDQRLTWLTRRPSAWSVLVPVVALAAGVMFATSAATAKGTNLRASNGDLPALIREQTHKNAVSAKNLRTLRSEVDRIAAQQAPGDLRVTQLTRKADALMLAAGTEAVVGPTVKVTLNDAKNVPATLPDGLSVDDYVVHQQDVQAVVDALWQGGAEAMMLMDQRVISTSAVRCVGNTLLLQGQVYSPPYRITAIGDPGRLRKALEDSAALQIYREFSKVLGLGWGVTEQGEQTFPAFTGSLDLRYATPLPTPLPSPSTS